MITTEFFKTLKAVEEFKPICNAKDIFSLDKRGTVKEFKSWLNDAIASDRQGINGVRAVVVMYR
jgi:hypothetical protein